MGHLRSETMDRLCEALLRLQTVDECYDFLEDLCTVREMKDLASRLDVAVQLKRGMNYQQVAEETGVSSATISRVKRSLEYGSGGYERMIGRLSDE